MRTRLSGENDFSSNRAEKLRSPGGDIAMQEIMTQAATTAASAAMNSNMTHYMELLATNQPWNLIIFMAIPVILAETLTATEFFVTFGHLYDGPLRQFNKIVGIALGFYFLGIFAYLVTTVVPHIEWRGFSDILAVGSYLSGVVFLFGIALLELGVIAKNSEKDSKMKLHFSLLIGFLVVAHIAMIFGMLNPTIL